jgi:hypothetical protein
MKLATLLRTPRPAHVFALDDGGLIYGRHGRQREALERVERHAMPPAWYQLGPVGVLQVERQSLTDALVALLPQLEPRPTRASVIVPNAWVRYLVLDLEALPRQREEAEDVLRWRLKKLLPCRPEDVRLDYLPLGRAGRVFVELALDRPLAAIEGAFETAGVVVGCIEPAVMALTALVPLEAQPALLVTVEDRAFAMALLAGDRVLLARQKTLPSDEQRAGQQLIQELVRTLAHAREQEELTDMLTLWLAPPDHPAAVAAATWATGQDGLALRRLAVGEGRVPALPPVPTLPLWAMLATSWGGHRG